MASEDTIKLNVEGMTCGHCQSAVKNALESVDGVQSAEVDLQSGVAVVKGASSVQDLIGAVEEEGYRATLAQ
jgi:copper chaperone